jgi:hypothetical protein
MTMRFYVMPMRWALLVCGLLVFAGCGSGGHGVSGKVTFEDGSPLTTGTVELDGPGGAGSGAIQPDGTYEITFGESGGVPDGTYRVKVEAFGEGTGGPGPSLVADKYRSFEDSGLTVTVAGASQEFNITVEKPSG